jgi:hypothetical protein
MVKTCRLDEGNKVTNVLVLKAKYSVVSSSWHIKCK